MTQALWTSRQQQFATWMGYRTDALREGFVAEKHDVPDEQAVDVVIETVSKESSLAPQPSSESHACWLWRGEPLQPETLQASLRTMFDDIRRTCQRFDGFDEDRVAVCFGRPHAERDKPVVALPDLEDLLATPFVREQAWQALLHAFGDQPNDA